MNKIFEEIKKAVINGDEDAAEELARRVLEERINPVDAVQKGYLKGIEEIGNGWKQERAFLGEVMLASDAMNAGLNVLESAINELGVRNYDGRGKIVLGTVEGDVHDIGKNIVGAVLTAAGFRIYDIGINQKPEDFLAKAEEVGADIIAASALLITTMYEQREIIEYLKEKNAREKYKVIVGGGATTKSWAEEIKADGWAGTAEETVELCKQLLT